MVYPLSSKIQAAVVSCGAPGGPHDFSIYSYYSGSDRFERWVGGADRAHGVTCYVFCNGLNNLGNTGNTGIAGNAGNIGILGNLGTKRPYLGTVGQNGYMETYPAR